MVPGRHRADPDGMSCPDHPVELPHCPRRDGTHVTRNERSRKLPWRAAVRSGQRARPRRKFSCPEVFQRTFAAPISFLGGREPPDHLWPAGVYQIEQRDTVLHVVGVLVRQDTEPAIRTHLDVVDDSRIDDH